MILQKLNAYYERLEADPKEDIASFGFSLQKISFCVLLEPDGTLHSFDPVVSEVIKGRSIPQKLIVPGQAKPPGAGINPCLLWDNATHILGQVPEEHDEQWARKRFEAFRDRHLEIEKDIDDPSFSAVCRFLEKWGPENLTDYPDLAEMTASFGVFRLRAQKGYVHDRPAVRSWWSKQIETSDQQQTGVCLVTGQSAPIARLHEPKIKGVADAQTGGASIISFNLTAFDSYGKTQSYNAPVSERATFHYATALNHLLADRRRRVQIGDATTVFWTERPTPIEEILASLFSGPSVAQEDTEDTETLDSIRAFLDCLRQGKPDDLADQLGDPDTPFYILGLSPNASRISIRYWLVSTISELCINLSRHVHDLDIVAYDDRPPTVQQLIRETAGPKKGFPDPSKIPKNLTGELLGAILTGRPYPHAFYMAILRRIRSEGFANRQKRKDWKRAMSIRAAAVKACLIRNFKKEIIVSLQTERPEAAYQLGRWFAALEKTQKDALGDNLNSTIKDKFYAAASATPATVFPRLIQLSQHHMSKIDNTGQRIVREKLIQEIASQIENFPRHLKIEDQGLFHLGYYHQTQAFYTKKNDSETPDNESE